MLLTFISFSVCWRKYVVITWKKYYESNLMNMLLGNVRKIANKTLDNKCTQIWSAIFNCSFMLWCKSDLRGFLLQISMLNFSTEEC